MQMFQTFMHDEAALLRAARAEWALVPLSYSARGTEPTEEPAVLVGEAGVTVGRHAENQIVCDSPTVRYASDPKWSLPCQQVTVEYMLTSMPVADIRQNLIACYGVLTTVCYRAARRHRLSTPA